MEYRKIKRNLENYTVRSIPPTVLTTNNEGETIINTSSPNYYYGTIPEYKIDKEGNFIKDGGDKVTNTIDINIFLKQDLDDMGLYTNKIFTSKSPMLTQKPASFNPAIKGRIPGAPKSFYYSLPKIVKGTTDDSSLKSVSSLRVDNNNLPIYSPNLNVSKDSKNRFDGVLVNNNQIIKYLIGGKIDSNGILVPNTGVKFTTYLDKFIRSVDNDGEEISWKKTAFSYLSNGWNINNTTLWAIMKHEEFLGMVFKPEISSDVFINRGIADIFERHAMLSELKTTNDMDSVRGGWLTVE